MASQPPPPPSVPHLPLAPEAPQAAALPLVDDIVVVKPNDALDVLVARDEAFAAEHPVEAPLPAGPPIKTTPAQEWGAAIVVMVVFLILCLAAVSFFRG